MNLNMQRVYLILFYFILLLINCEGKNLSRKKRIVGGRFAAKYPEDDPAVYVNKDNRNARIYGMRDPNKGFYVFKGIRFAEAPTGQQRFNRATAVHLNGEYNATKWGAPCSQQYKGEIIGSEDCLFLNVFTPMLPDSGDGYPVLVWIHGGGFRIGAACQYEMRNLIKKKMIVVSIQYRLGSLGFLSLGSKEFPGNSGMFDMILAIRWVRKYIEFFGGNPNQIIPFGQGSGAGAALLLSLSKYTKNYFSGLIAMSGSLLSHFVIDKNPVSTSKQIAIQNNCPTGNLTEMMRCLQGQPVENLILADTMLAKIRSTADGYVSGISALISAGPVVDGADDMRSRPNFVVDSPENLLSLDQFPGIPLLTGVINDEVGKAIFGGFKREIESKLTSIPNYCETTLVPKLQNKISMFGNVTRRFVPNAFKKYLQVDNLDNLKQSLDKVKDSINDAIFNVPAFQMLKYWSKKAKTFFYNIHSPNKRRKRSYGKEFLSGLPLVDATSSSSDLSHGDDLGYLFEPNDIYGDKIVFNDTQDESEKRISENYSDMIAQFARMGRVKTDSKELKEGEPTIFKVSDKVEVIDDFRSCEIGLWTTEIKKITSTFCDTLHVTTETVAYLQNQTQSLLGNAGNIMQNVSVPKITPPKLLNFVARPGSMFLSHGAKNNLQKVPEPVTLPSRIFAPSLSHFKLFP